MNEYVIRCWGIVGHIEVPTDLDPTGLLLESSDVDAHGGRGDAMWTNDPAEAKHFATPMDAMEYWRRQSTVQPTRPWDGKPNRPLTVFTVEVVSLTHLAAEQGAN